MKNSTAFLKRLPILLTAAVVALGGAASGLVFAQDAAKPVQPAAVSAQPMVKPTPPVLTEVAQRDAQIVRGEYLAQAGDCISCHTRAKGAPFAGGLPMKTPFGTIISTNITPDKEQGIGNYTAEDLAVHCAKARRQMVIICIRRCRTPTFHALTTQTLPRFTPTFCAASPRKNKIIRK